MKVLCAMQFTFEGAFGTSHQERLGVVVQIREKLSLNRSGLSVSVNSLVHFQYILAALLSAEGTRTLEMAHKDDC